MSVPDTPRPPPPPQLRRREGLGGCLVGALVTIGLLLLLPGFCSLMFIFSSGRGGGIPGGIVVLWMITFVIAAAGIALIHYATKRK